MPVTFILGRAGTGKTRRCLDALLAELQKPDESRRLVLLVPEQASFQMERTLASRAPRHGYWRAEVLSFSRLALRLCEQAGGEPAMLRPTSRTLALRCVAGDTPEILRAFGAAARTVGFFTQLDRLIEELLVENVSPGQLAEAADRLKDVGAQRRAAALAGVYRGYLDWLGPERIDAAQRLAALREQLAGLAWLPEASVWVDGFAGFTGQELETLVALADRARDVAITLLLDPAAPEVRDVGRPPDVLNLFHRTATTCQRLIQRLTEAGVELRPPIVLQPRTAPRFGRVQDLARLEAALATPIGARDPSPERSSGSGAQLSSSGQVRVVECETHRDELRAAARFIRRKVLESSGKLRFRDFAVIGRDLEAFAPMVADVFAEYELPYFLDRRRSLGVHALARFVRALLDSVAADFSTVATTRLLRCGLLPLSRLQAETLENTVVANEIRTFEAWQPRRWPFEPDETLDKRRVSVAAALEPLVRLTGPGPAPTAAQWANTLHRTLTALRVPDRIAAWIAAAQRARDWETAEVHRLAWDTLCDMLEDLHDVLGPRPVELTELAGIIESALGDLTVGLAPPTLDQVLVSSIERSRHPDIRYAWVFALNEGIFPARPGDDALLSTADRELLAEAGLSAPRPRRDDAFAERLLAYIALTRPSHGLTISYARVGDDGEPRFASPFVDEVCRALPGLEVEKAREDEPPVCLGEFARGYLGVRAVRLQAATTRRRYDRLRDELSSSPTLGPRLQRLLRGLTYDNSPAAVPGYWRRAEFETGVLWSGSPSELETYLQCPFQHFALHGLALSEWRGPAPAALELGRHAHEVLAAVTERAIAATQPVCSISDDQWLALLRDVVQDFEARQPDDLTKRRPQAAFLSKTLCSFLEEVVLAHAERWRRGLFEPLACEQRFEPAGRKGPLNALELASESGERIRLHGVIDRIDRCEHEGRTYLLVYDYKSAQKGVAGAYLTQDRLQLFTYLLAVKKAYLADDKTRVAGVFLAPLYPDAGVLDKKYVAGACEAELRMYLYCPRGLFDQDSAPLLDRQLGRERSPVALMRLTKSGEFYKHSDAKPAAELEARLELAERTALYVANHIARGCIDVAPLLENKTLACRNCELGPLCRFEPIFNRPRVAETSLPVLERVEAGDDSGGAQ